ncbi:MAG: helix-turn-helix domain-containing protein [Chloroflexi bacterium]|nr:helix-turn-helix domain-containing protein [Chloroflexota bacterium]
MEKEIFTTREAARYLGVSASTIYRMEKQGLISSLRTPGGQRRFNKESIESYLARSQDFEAPQNPSRYRKPALLVREVEAVFTAAPLYHDKPPSIDDLDQANDLFFHRDSVWIIKADFLKTQSISEGSVDLVVTSPPYNVDVKYNSHNDTMSYVDYLSFTREWLTRCYELLRDDGRFCLNIPLDKNKGGQQSVCADITTIAKQVGFNYHSTIIWNEQNISRRTAWGSWLSAAAPYVIAPVEAIVVLYKRNWKKRSGGRQSDITRKEFLEWTNGVWNFMGESKKRVGHPAPFPIELPRRCIKLFSFVGDTVLDPFLGSGSTLIACLQANRKGIGVEIDDKYCDLAKKRLLEVGKLDQLRFDLVTVAK